MITWEENSCSEMPVSHLARSHAESKKWLSSNISSCPLTRMLNAGTRNGPTPVASPADADRPREMLYIRSTTCLACGVVKQVSKAAFSAAVTTPDTVSVPAPSSYVTRSRKGPASLDRSGFSGTFSDTLANSVPASKRVSCSPLTKVSASILSKPFSMMASRSSPSVSLNLGELTTA